MRKLEISKRKFGEKATLLTLKNDHGFELSVTDYGARITSLIVPVAGHLRNLVLGFDSAEEYIEKDTYMGATIGRFAGRIKNGIFRIDNQQYQTPIDKQTGHILHGGYGFDKYFWTYSEKIETNQVSVTFTLKSAAGTEGFPGDLFAEVTYKLTNENEWILVYKAETDEPTIYNPTNHVYFNLDGDPTIPIDHQVLKIMATKYIEVDSQVIPTGNIRVTRDTPFDFSQGKKIGDLFDHVGSELSKIDGLDHPFLLDTASTQVCLISADKKVSLEMTTDDPAVVVFTANFGNNGPLIRGKKVANHGGLTLETQVPPGVTDYCSWGNVILRPEDKYEKTTKFKFYIS
ncbi:aldose epimerase family protein [Enterococcus sp. LJL99]